MVLTDADIKSDTNLSVENRKLGLITKDVLYLSDVRQSEITVLDKNGEKKTKKVKIKTGDATDDYTCTSTQSQALLAGV